MVLVKQ